jgi:hypothetical protein
VKVIPDFRFFRPEIAFPSAGDDVEAIVSNIVSNIKEFKV